MGVASDSQADGFEEATQNRSFANVARLPLRCHIVPCDVKVIQSKCEIMNAWLIL